MEVKKEIEEEEECRNTAQQGKGVKRRRSDILQKDGRLGACKICGCQGNGVYFGVLTCIPCKVSCNKM